MDIKQKKIDRFHFLKAVYEAVGGSTSMWVDMWELGEELGFSREVVNKIFEYLKAEGLLVHADFGGSNRIVITHQGILEIEEALSNPEEETEHFLPINIINVENMSNSVIQQGTSNSNVSVIFESSKLDKLETLIDKLEEITSVFTEIESLKEFKAELDTLKSQKSSPKPKRFIIQESLKTIRHLIEGVTASAMTPKILELISQLL